MTEEDQGSKGIKHNHHDTNTAGGQLMEQNGCEFNTHHIESDEKGTSTCEASISDEVMLKVVFTSTVANGNSSKSSFSGSTKSANSCDGEDTAEKLDSAIAYGQDSLKMCEMTNAVSTSGENFPGLKSTTQAESTPQNAPERTVSNINHVLNGDDVKSKVDSTTTDVLVAAMQVEEIDGEETNTVVLSKSFTTDKQQKSLIQSYEEDTKANVAVPSNQETTGENQVVEGAENLNDEKPTTPETVKPNNEQKRSASSSAGNPQERDKSPKPRKRTSTISFKVESTTLLKEASLEIEPSDVVVSSCSTSPISELEEDSADVVIVNPEAEQVSYTPAHRKRVKSGLDSVIKKSANSALKRSVKVNTASLAVKELDDAIDGENLLPAPRVGTLDRFRNTFSWGRGRSLTRQSFAAKSKDNFLSFHNISYRVQQKKFFQALGTKVILKNVR